MDKLKDILFDEETVEIPIIGDDDFEDVKPKKRKKVPRIEKTNHNTEEIKVTKIEDEEKPVSRVQMKEVEETPKFSDTLFDMPKLKEEADEEVRTSSFTFPVFDDDELEIVDNKREVSPVSGSFSPRTTRSEEPKEYKRDVRRNESPRYSNYAHGKEEKKPFSLSPIISPVYGILNENYTKDDIVSREERSFTRSSFDNKPNLDEVRKKAYGTIEEEVNITISKQSDEIINSIDEADDIKESVGNDGISIDDLLVEEDTPIIEKTENTPKAKKEKPKEKPVNEDTDDLFDLIDSLYEGGK